MINLIQLFITGLSVGLIYGLVAVGFVMIYKSSQIFNFAQGEMVMVGAYLAWTFLVSLGLPGWLGMLAVFVIAGGVGYGLERFPLRPMIGQPVLATIMVTMGIAIFLQGLAILIWSTDIGIKFPPILAEKNIDVFGVPLSNVIVANFVLVIVLVILLSLFSTIPEAGFICGPRLIIINSHRVWGSGSRALLHNHGPLPRWCPPWEDSCWGI